MNTPTFQFNAAPPPHPFGGAANFLPGMNDMSAVVAPPNWAEKAQALIREKVLVDSKPITTPQMEVWAYNKVRERMGGGDNIDQRMCEGLEKTPAGAVNLGNDNEEALTPEQRQADILALIPQKLTWAGALCTGDNARLGEIAFWLLSNVPAVAGLADQNQQLVALHNWLREIKTTYELDAATRATQQTPPVNPVSDQTTPQVAQEIKVPEPVKKEEEEEGGEALVDPVDGTRCKSLRGLKTRVTKTHKSDWGPFCAQHGLDPLTGKKGAEGTVRTAPIAPTSTPPASAPLPALIGQGAAVDASAIPAYNSLYGPDGKPTPAYAAAQQAASEQMPVPPKQQPSSPVSVTPMFQPTTQPQPQNTIAPYIPAATSIVPISNLPHTPAAAFVASTTPPIQPTPSPVPYTPSPTPVPQNTQSQKINIAPGLNRAQMAQALGGEVRMIVCRLLEVNNVNLTGCTDANQLALLAEKLARDEMRIVDLAQAQYGAGKQTAQRHFADLLTKYPNCYMLMNGFEPILSAGYLEILIARTTYVYHVSERGGAVEIKF
jgi:hypothetical protein